MRQLLARLPDGVTTLAGHLAETGFHTVAISANPFISNDFGLLSDFGEVVEAFHPGALPGEHFRFHANHFRRLAGGLSVAPEQLVLARSAALHELLLARLPREGDSFVLLWSMDPHAPFFVRGEHSYFGNPLDRVIPAAHTEWLNDGLTVRDIISLYRDMIAYQDKQFGPLMMELQARGLWHSALIVVAGDHGEAIGEHGVMGHTNGLWEEQIRVPLLIKYPQQAGTTIITTPVSLLDIVPTILSIVAITSPNSPIASFPTSPMPAALYGRSLLAAPERPLLLENPDGWALRHGEWKLLAPTDEQPPLLFNLHSDPSERRPLLHNNLHRELFDLAGTIQEAADRHAEQFTTSSGNGDEGEVDDAVLERLRQLGYLD
jgi:arylsulfatase A-like enzyme